MNRKQETVGSMIACSHWGKGLFCILALLCGANSVSAKAVWADPHPIDDDVRVSMPCGASMVFRKIYTGSSSAPSCVFTDQPNSDNQCRVQGNFEDSSGFYFLLAKYELSEYQYQVLTSYKCPVYSKKLELPAVGHSRDDYRRAASVYSDFLQTNTDTPSQEGIKATAGLPSDCDWAFALRGGLKVSSETLTSKNPSGAFGSDNMRDFAYYQGDESASGKLQLPGRLKPNVLGLYDMLGNAQEIMEDPYRGGGSGMTIRGGSYLTPKGDIDNELRLEKPLYIKGKATKAKDTATRFELGVPHYLSTQDVERKKKLDKKEPEKNLTETLSSEQKLNADNQISTGTQSKFEDNLETTEKEDSNDLSGFEALYEARLKTLYADHYRINPNITEKHEQYKNTNDQDDINAQTKLWPSFLSFMSLQSDYNRARVWTLREVEHETIAAQNNLDEIYYNSVGISQDFYSSAEDIKRAAEHGNTEAEALLGFCYARGEGINKNFKKAREYFLLAADKGNDFAQSWLGLLYETGDGVTQDYSEAVKWYHKSAEKNNGLALKHLGDFYQNGKGVEINLEKAAKYYKRVCDLYLNIGCKLYKKVINKNSLFDSDFIFYLFMFFGWSALLFKLYRYLLNLKNTKR